MTHGQLRLAEVLAGLALATDFAMGQPAGHVLQTSVLAARLAGELGGSDADVADTLYVALLRYIGCTADAAEVARASGDEIALAVAVGPWVMDDASVRAVHTPVPDPDTAMAHAMAVHCEAAGMLGSRLGLTATVTDALRHGFERWDGRGHPFGVSGREVPQAIRIGVLARDVVLWQRLAGSRAAREMAVRRRGHAYDPDAVDAYLSLSGADEDVSWSQVLAAEPSPRLVDEQDVDGLLEVFADFADLKVPWALGHSRRVAATAAGAGAALGLDTRSVSSLRRAGLLHDLGRCGISSGIWGKVSPWTADEWERVRLHPYLTDRILRRSAPLADLAGIAASHHERLDGSGYHRGLTAAALGRPERVLAAADAYASMREEWPSRSACDAAQTVRRLSAEVEAGRLDGGAVRAVVEAAAEARPPRTLWPAGLSDREIDVLRLAARGLTIRQVAARLAISPKTVDRHLQHGYAKTGVSSRAGAALFAVRHGLLD